MFPEGRLLEFLIVGAVALVVVGPKDLPVLMRKVGQFIARMRAMAAEFRASFDELARQSELDELRKEVEALRNATPMRAAADAAGVTDIEGTFDEIDAAMRESPTPMLPMASYQHPPEPDQAAAPLPPEVVKAAPPAKRARKPKAASAKPAPRKPRARKPRTDEIVR